jgi:hypothetical protein
MGVQRGRFRLYHPDFAAGGVGATIIRQVVNKLPLRSVTLSTKRTRLVHRRQARHHILQPADGS